MASKGKILFIALVALLAFSTLATFYQYYVLQDYVIAAEAECDPETESCFTWICDPEVDGEEWCTGDLAEDTWYYKVMYRNAKNVPNCEPYDEDCDALHCPEGEEGCEIELCTPEVVEEEEMEYECTDPDTFVWPDYFLEAEDEEEEVAADSPEELEADLVTEEN